MLFQNNKPEYHLEPPDAVRNYQRWRRNQLRINEQQEPLDQHPFFSVVIPVYNTARDHLTACIDSVLAQSYSDFELILVDDHSTWEEVRPVLRAYEDHDHVHVIYRPENGHISVAANDGIAVARGEFIAFMDCDDTIEPDALYQFARKLNGNPDLDFIYSDEDKVTEDGKIYHMPYFKPDWSPDLFLNMMYTNHLAVYRTSIVREIGGLRTEYNGSQYYDMTLRFMEQSDNRRVGHIARVLYHWRERTQSVAFAMGAKYYSIEKSKEAKEDYIRRNQLSAYVEQIKNVPQYRIVYRVVGDPLVSIVIPSKDNPEILKQCIDSITTYEKTIHYEIIVVDNGSNKTNRKIIRGLLDNVGGKYIFQKQKFNFSHMCNMGAKSASGEYILFLNDDVEFFQPDHLRRMLGQAQQKHVGAVGCKLLYPNSSIIQHDGVSSIEGPRNSFCGWDDKNDIFLWLNRVDQDCIAVTGACLMVNTAKFKAVGGFDEALPIAYNDVALCYALTNQGFYNVLRNDVVAYHHESLSRGNDLIDDEKMVRLNQERMYLEGKYPQYKGKDPFLNIHLHTWANHLDIKNNTDAVRIIELQDHALGGQFVIDDVAGVDQIRLSGWSFNVDCLEYKNRTIILRDPYGILFEVETLMVERQDLVDDYHDARYLYAGLEAVIDRKALRLDLFSYRVGVKVEGIDGTTWVTWWEYVNIRPSGILSPCVKDYQTVKSISIHECDDSAHWSLDSCEPIVGNRGYKIRGFAFREGRNHLDACQIILRGTRGQALILEPQREERLDISLAYPREHFLYNTGFVCFVYEPMLPAKDRYEIIIRLIDRLDETNMQDIQTPNVIEVY